jgi:hypothetical protein
VASGALDLPGDGGAANVVQYSFSNGTWSAVGSGSDLPGPVTAVEVNGGNSSSIFAAGRYAARIKLTGSTLAQHTLLDRLTVPLSCRSGMVSLGNNSVRASRSRFRNHQGSLFALSFVTRLFRYRPIGYGPLARYSFQQWDHRTGPHAHGIRSVVRFLLRLRFLCALRRAESHPIHHLDVAFRRRGVRLGIVPLVLQLQFQSKTYATQSS